MTEDQLKELESLDRMAVSAPWAWEKCYEMTIGGRTVEHWAMVEPGRETKSVIHYQLVMLSTSKPHGDFGFLDVPEVQLLLAARNALPGLLAEVARLKNRLAGATVALEDVDNFGGDSSLLRDRIRKWLKE